MDIDHIADVSSAAAASEEPRGAKRGANADAEDSLFMPEATTAELVQNKKRAKTQDATLRVYESGDRPCLAIYHPSFAAAEREVQEVCDAFIEVHETLRANGYNNEAIQNVCNDLVFHRTPSKIYPAVGPVACLGPAGVGKSSSINSLLDQKMAAPESDGAERGTFVVHEYTAAHPTQFQQYRIEVSYRSEREIATLIAKHHTNITNYKAVENQEMEGDEDEDADLQKKYETGIEFFCDTLCDQDEFQTLEEVESYFEERKDDENKDVRSDLASMVISFRESRVGSGDVELFDARDEAELIDTFKKVSRPNNNRHKKGRKPSPWPLIPKVQVRQNLAILNAEVTLGDTAGINDSNLSVVENTREYLTNAGTILVFANMMRIAKNTDLDAHLRECILLGKINNIILVVTKIEAKSSSSASGLDDIDEMDEARLSRARNDISRLEREVKDTKAEKANETDDTKFREHDQRLQTLVAKLATGKASLHQLTIDIQCRIVAAKLEDKLQKLGKSKKAPKLKTVFVSNTEYQKHSNEDDEQESPSLDREATGIPKLRRLLYGIPARGKLHILQSICAGRLPNIFTGIQGILTKSTLERKAEVKSLLQKQLAEHHKIVSDFCKKMSNRFEKEVVGCIEEHHNDWSDAGAELVQAWDKQTKPATFAAFCRKSGVWRLPSNTKKMIYWNSQIRAIFDNVLAEAFEELVDKLNALESQFEQRLKGIFNKLKEQIENAEAAQGIPMRAFFNHVFQVKAGMEAEFAGKFDALKLEIEKIRVECVVEGKTTYVASIMEDTYEKCAKFAQQNFKDESPKRSNGKRQVQKRTGHHALRVECVQNRITGESDGDSIFRAVGQQAKKALERHLATWEEQCGVIMAKGETKILQDFDSRFQESEVKEEEDPEAVAKLQEAASKAMSVINGSMKKHLEECVAYEKGGA